MKRILSEEQMNKEYGAEIAIDVPKGINPIEYLQESFGIAQFYTASDTEDFDSTTIINFN